MNVLHVGRDVATLRSITEPKQESPLLREGTSSAKSVEDGTGPPANPVERQRILGRAMSDFRMWVTLLHMSTDDNSSNTNAFQMKSRIASLEDAVFASARSLLGRYNGKGSIGEKEPILHFLQPGKAVMLQAKSAG